VSIGAQVTSGTLLILAGLGLMSYSIYALEGIPYVYLPVLLWVTTVEYMLCRTWWEDVKEVYGDRRYARVVGRR
jgi:hypothetical protein